MVEDWAEVVVACSTFAEVVAKVSRCFCLRAVSRTTWSLGLGERLGDVGWMV